jgi:dTMP kinase
MNKGKYIVIEGLTNYREEILQRLSYQLAAARLPVKTMRDPESQNDPTARAIHRLTHDPRYPMTNRTEVLLYNAARSQSLEVIGNAINNGIVCLADRSYLTTLTLHYYGRGTVTDYQKIQQVIDFAIEGTEPDLTVVLDTPVASLNEAIRRKFSIDYATAGVQDDALLERVRAGYLWEAKQRGLPVVYATDDVDTVFKEVWKHVAATLAVRDKSAQTSEPQSVAEVLAAKLPMQVAPAEPPITAAIVPSQLSEPANKPSYQTLEASFRLEQTDEELKPDYFIPKKLTKKVMSEYLRVLDEILQSRAKLIEKLQAAKVDSREAARLTLPIAGCLAAADRTAISNLLGTAGDKLVKLAREQLHETHDGHLEPIQLTDYWPKSELSLVPAALYPHSNLSLEQLADQVDAWPYIQKSDALGFALENANPVLTNTSYTLDVLADYRELLALRARGISVRHQRLTPRYGYEVPNTVELAGQTDLFEACFDASLALYSQLQAAGFEIEAQLTTLVGHKLRFTLSLSATQILQLLTVKDLALQRLLPGLCEAIASVHPLIATAFTPKTEAQLAAH